MYLIAFLVKVCFLFFFVLSKQKRYYILIAEYSRVFWNIGTVIQILIYNRMNRSLSNRATVPLCDSVKFMYIICRSTFSYLRW